MTKKQKQNLIRIIVSFIMLVALMFVELNTGALFVLYLIPYLIVGHDILKKAWKGMINRQPLDENLLMSIATLGAFALAIYRTGDFAEAVAVMLFYQVGEFFQNYAVGRSRRNIGELMDIRPDHANIEISGEIEKVDPDEVEKGSVIIVRPGEKIPIDGIVIEGEASLDTGALTGESIPRKACTGDEVLSGCINRDGLLRIRTTREFEESTASKILDLVENASSRKAKTERFISRFARVYTPVVVISAVALALVPPVIRTFVLGMSADMGEWVYRALTFLVISCPCALVISIPLSFFAAIGGASRDGILIKGANYMEVLSNVDAMVMDKTGTLTEGNFIVTGVVRARDSEWDEKEILRYAATAEKHSSHPIAIALREACDSIYDSDVSVREIAGKGVVAHADGKKICVGNEKMLQDRGMIAPEVSEGTTAAETLVFVSIDDSYAGCIRIRDKLKEGAAEAVKMLRQSGVRRLVMLTGDNSSVAEAVASELGIDEVYAQLLPEDKVAIVEEIIEGKSNEKGAVAFAGDGINDAPVLSRSDVGIAMGALGSDAAIEAADIVLMDDDPGKIARAMRISRRCMRIVRQNIVLAIGIKVLCLMLCALGLAGMWLAIFADVGVMVLAVLNSMRTLVKVKDA